MSGRKLRGDGDWHLIRGRGSEGIAYNLTRNEYDPDCKEWDYGIIKIATITDTAGLLDEPPSVGNILVTECTIELEDLPGKGKSGTDIMKEALDYLAYWGGKEWFTKSRAAAWKEIW